MKSHVYAAHCQMTDLVTWAEADSDLCPPLDAVLDAAEEEVKHRRAYARALTLLRGGFPGSLPDEPTDIEADPCPAWESWEAVEAGISGYWQVSDARKRWMRTLQDVADFCEDVHVDDWEPQIIAAIMADVAAGGDK